VIGALVVQATIVTVMLVNAMMPLWNGQDVTIMARAVDPRDLLRGDYVALDYDINRVLPRSIKTDLQSGDQLRYGQELYVTLDLTDSTAVATGIYQTRPSQGLFIRGRSRYPQMVPSTNDTSRFSGINITYGIEEYYTDSETAQKLEVELRMGATLPVHLKIDTDGNARIYALGK
jgi:uncharacterized membrane-anchored protein